MRSARATLSDSGPKSGSNPNPKSGTAKQDSSDSEPSENPTPKAVSGKSTGKSTNNGTNTNNSNNSVSRADNSDPVTAKSSPAPVIVVPDPTTVPDQAFMLKTAETLKTAEAPSSQPHSNPEPAVPIDIFALTQPAAPSSTVAGQAPATPPTESSDDDTQAPVAPGNLVFQLSLDSSEPAQKARIVPAEQDNETTVFLSGEEASSSPQTQTAAPDSDTKSQDQQGQPQPSLPQLPSAGAEGTIASQFGFQTPLSFAMQASAPKTESFAAPASPRMTENVSTPDLPMAPSIDRIGLTIRGADDQVVRVEISQSGELVQVGVHTGNNDLANQLRASVPELVHRLDQQGYESRLSMPASSFASLGPPVTAGAQSEFRSGADQNGNAKSNSDAAPQQELRQQRQRNPQRTWRELASQLQED
jgi:hypothetical protein